MADPLAGSTLTSAFASFDLPSAPERYLARALAQTLDEGWRSPEDFIRHFPPHAIMQALAEQDVLRASILIGAAGVHAKLARKKPIGAAADDLELALEEGVTDARQILELFAVEDCVRFLEAQALWAFLCEDEFWTQIPSDAGHASAVARLGFLLGSALDEDLITLQEVVEGIGFAAIADSLPPARLRDVVRHALEIGHTGRAVDEQALLEVVPLTELLEHVPLEQMFRGVLLERVAVPAGFADSAAATFRSSVRHLPDPREDAEVDDAFASLQAGPAAVKRNGAGAPEPAPGNPPPLPARAPAPAASKEKTQVDAGGWDETLPPDSCKETAPPPPHAEQARQRVSARLQRMDRLPPAHASLALPVLLSIESMYTELLTLTDEEARERCIYDSFPNQQHLRTAMLALIELLDSTIDTRSEHIAGADLESLMAVVLFEERRRDDQKVSPAASGARPNGRQAAPVEAGVARSPAASTPTPPSSTVPPASRARVATRPPLPHNRMASGTMRTASEPESLATAVKR